MPRASSAAASGWYTLFLALDGLAAEEELRPELVPLLALVERDGGVDDLVRKLVERRVDREAPVPARLQKVLVRGRQLRRVHQARVVAEDEEREARRDPLAMALGKGRRRELGECRRIEILEQLLATQCLHAMRAGLEHIGAVVRGACLGERPLHDLLGRAAPVDELHAALPFERGPARAAVLDGHRAI